MNFSTIRKLAASTLAVIRSDKFFYGVVILLIVQGLWIALTARYPMAFDENFHFGVIQIYANQWSPFITSTPPDSGAYGELIRTTSYLYHYLMSFPYRFIALFTHDQTTQVLLLRFINIGLFTGGLFAFRRLLQQLHVSSGIINLSLFIVVLIPVVPFLAGQINYDNLTFLLVPLTGLLAVSCARAVTQKGYLPASSFIVLLCIGMLGSLVKYAFIPIFAAALLYLGYVIFRHKKYAKIFAEGWRSFTRLPVWAICGLGALLIVSTSLFAERYGVNVLTYGAIEPDCADIESVDHCLQYGPWGRNYGIEMDNQVKGNTGLPNLAVFLPEWVGGMMHRLYFAISYDYTNYQELPLPIITAYITGFIGLILACFYGRTLIKNPGFILAILIVALYVLALLYTNFKDYVHYKTMLAINGRYLILVLPLAFALMASSYALFIKQIVTAKTRFKNTQLVQFSLVAAVIVLTLQGGGILTFAVRSDSGWYWENPTAQALGSGLKNAATPFIFGAKERGNPA
jgi:hypothetical protein